MNKIISEQLLLSTDVGLVSICMQEDSVRAILVSSGMMFDLPDYSEKEELLNLEYSKLTLDGYYLSNTYVVNEDYTFSYAEDGFEINIKFKRGDLICNDVYRISTDYITPMLTKGDDLFYPDTLKVVDELYEFKQFGRFAYKKFLGTWE